MKIKIFGLAILLGLAAALGACEGGGDTPSAPATTPAEPADTGATPAPGGATPAATTPAAPSPTGSP